MKRVFIYGGCTSRDAVDYYPQHGLELQAYVARQSLISAFKPAAVNEFNTQFTESNFQRRMYEGDIQGNLAATLRKNAPKIDVLVWDLMIERNGVARVRSGGLVTRNGVPKKEGMEAIGGAYAFASDGHFRLWTWALDRWVALLDQMKLKEKTILNATPWALIDNKGQLVKSQGGMTAEFFNNNIERYWDAAEEQGIKVVRLPQDVAVADTEHKWGKAFFHYVPETYEAQLDALTKVI